MRSFSDFARFLCHVCFLGSVFVFMFVFVVTDGEPGSSILAPFRPYHAQKNLDLHSRCFTRDGIDVSNPTICCLLEASCTYSIFSNDCNKFLLTLVVLAVSTVLRLISGKNTSAVRNHVTKFMNYVYHVFRSCLFQRLCVLVLADDKTSRFYFSGDRSEEVFTHSVIVATTVLQYTVLQ